MTNKPKIIISAPSLDPRKNVSGVSSVVKFIIDNNPKCDYLHFEIGRKDNEKNGVNRVFSLCKALFTWNKLLRDNPNALIHYSFPLSAPSILRDPFFMFIAKMAGRKMVIHIHGGIFLNSEKIPFIINKILNWVFSWNVPFIVLSDLEKERLHNHFGVKSVFTLPNCVDLKDAESFERKNQEKTLRLGYLGRIEANKGMNELLDACVQLKKKGRNFILDVAGKEVIKDSFIPLFEKELGKMFHYSGVIGGKEKNEYLRSLDVFILPSYFEGLPMSLLECMSYGSAAITTPVGSIPELVKNGENGLFVEVKNSESIVKWVEELDNDREKLVIIGKNARNTIFDKYSPAAYIGKLNGIYNKLR